MRQNDWEFSSKQLLAKISRRNYLTNISYNNKWNPLQYMEIHKIFITKAFEL